MYKAIPIQNIAFPVTVQIRIISSSHLSNLCDAFDAIDSVYLESLDCDEAIRTITSPYSILV